jgi:glucose-1-phosphate cytidylyltransferase
MTILTGQGWIPIIKTVILCGGLGTRLREETEFRPKPMVSIGPRPILWHIMKSYSKCGFKDFVLALGYKGEMIREYFCNYELLNNDVTIKLGHPEETKIYQAHDERDWTITMIDTGERTLKGGRLKRVQKYITGEEFFVTYGDGLADIDLNGLLAFHRSHGKLATVTGVNPASRFGELSIKGAEVTEFNEKPEISTRFVNGGFFVFNRGIFDYLDETPSGDLEPGALEKVAHEGELMVYKHPGKWVCMDTLRDMEYLNGLWNENKAFWKSW